MTTRVRAKPFVFVLMPFAPAYKDVYVSGIKPACTAAGATAERVDDQIFTESIVERIYAQIRRADLVVADMSDRNPNVFYEVGYAHALGKRVVLLTRDAGDIPFDLRAYPHVIYGGDVALLRAELPRRIAFLLKAARTPAKKIEPTVLVYHEGHEVKPTDELWFDLTDYTSAHPAKLVLDFHVPESPGFGEVKQRFAVVASPHINYFADWSSTAMRTRLPDGRSLFSTERMKFKLAPGEWLKYEFTFSSDLRVRLSLEEFAIRFFTGYGTVDVPFRVHVRKAVAS